MFSLLLGRYIAICFFLFADADKGFISGGGATMNPVPLFM